MDGAGHPPTCRVLLVDDHPRFRALAGALLRRGGFDVVGEAATVADALQAVARARPEVIVLDVGLPDGDGIDAAAAIAAGPDAPAVVLVSSRTAAEFGTRLHDACARGFITKGELSAAAVRALL